MTGVLHIVLARKPIEGTVAENCLQWGCGAINIDGTRIAGDEDGSRNRPPSVLGSTTTYAQDKWTRTAIVQRQDTTGFGRWPANLIVSGEEVVKEFPEAGNNWKKNYGEEDYQGRQYNGGSFGGGGFLGGSTYCDSGSAARFFFNYTEQESDE